MISAAAKPAVHERRRILVVIGTLEDSFAAFGITPDHGPRIVSQSPRPRAVERIGG
jgi:hypothetical protein